MNKISFRRLITLSGAIILISGVFSGCGSNSNQKVLDTTTSGEINISVDETFEPIVQAELDVFHAIYLTAKIKAHYKSEGDVINDLITDSARAIVVTRELTPAELKPLQDKKLVVRSTKFAIDAIALIINPANTDSTFSMPNLRDIFSGTISNWNELDKANANEDITVVFDNPNSSTVRYMKEMAGKNQFSAKNFFALKTNKEVIEYVSKHKNALGIIGVNWISDSDDSTATGFLKKIKVGAIAPDDGQPGSGEYRKPYQAYIAQGFYPLVRRVYVLSRESHMGLGTGFAAFVAGDKGQRIVLKSGLVPARMPIRLIQISDNNLFQ
ncbi:substrate-binding domain-containing protein [Solitalea sp. MAHUQ-68]|uniref:Substrate-binding domain-containing protein n=1 Tax=Solitalea agri TaxID=2953739 RepID=A0A9X2EYJ1_9SPHI|nr:substrate-binding domain-containing protein [Solitalea agri]MCO4291267.1 substrate-binding domain-containing protein [Solitalea agri]